MLYTDVHMRQSLKFSLCSNYNSHIMREAIGEGPKIKPPEICQQEDLSKRAEEFCGCVADVSALLMRMSTDILNTPEGTALFEAATALMASLERQIAIITRETTPNKQD